MKNVAIFIDTSRSKFIQSTQNFIDSLAKVKSGEYKSISDSPGRTENPDFDTLAEITKKAIQFIDDHPEIDTIILATYLYENNYEYLEDYIWYNNARANNEEFDEEITKILNGPLKDNTEYQNSPCIGATPPKLLNKVWEDRYQVAAHWPEELDPYIEKVYIFGEIYEDCVVNRPLGVNSLRKNFTADIYSVNGTVQGWSKNYGAMMCTTSEDDFRLVDFSKEPEWEHVEGDIYKNTKFIPKHEQWKIKGELIDEYNETRLQ